MAEKKTFTVTPWEVIGEIDYEKITREFGIQELHESLLKKLQKQAGELHFMLKRKIFAWHRDLDWILTEYSKGNKFYLYTGRGPSGHTHLGHLVPWIFTKWLQDKFGAELYFQMTDDEKFVFNPKLSLKETNAFSYENALDVIALGFNPKKTFIFSNLDYCKTLYPQALKVAKRLTFSTAKAVFGFTHSSNVGQIFFTSMQSVPAFLPSVQKKRNIPCLIPLAVDQDPHFRVSRDILPKLGYFKPAIIHCMFLPGLGEGGKMSASDPSTAIFTTDEARTAEKKVMNAFTGGRETIKRQKELGGRADICPVYKYYYFLFEESDKKLQERYKACTGGQLLCGDCKKELAKRVVAFLKKHQENRKKAKKVLKKFVLKD